MSFSNSPSSERRLSVNGNNAYIILNSQNNSNLVNLHDPNFNQHYLTAKTNSRARSCSPSLSIEKIHSEQTEKMTTVNASSVCKDINTVDTANGNNAQKPKGALPKPSTPKTSVQTGLDRYITVVKRQRSPKSAKIASSSKHLKDDIAPKSQNRFSILDEVSNDEPVKGKPSKPPPIYLREQNSNELVKSLIELTGENSFYVVPIKRGKIYETKIQVLHEDNFRKVVSALEKKGKNFYTYQLKSSKGLQIVIKGIDSCVDPLELKSELEDKGFKIKVVVNIRNRENIPQPLFRVELEPGDIKLKKSEVHPIYNLKYLLHRKVTVEQPHKRTGPVQCLNCQEFGHTRAYCKLPTVCVVCGELHNSSNCDKSRTDEKVKKCSNCGKNHTANYRGCPVYSAIYGDMKMRKHVLPVPKTNYTLSYANVAATQNKPHIQILPQDAQSYANVVRSHGQHPADSNIQCDPPNPNINNLETTLDKLVQTINNFTNSMNNMMQEMMRMQSMLLQTLLSKP